MPLLAMPTAITVNVSPTSGPSLSLPSTSMTLSVLSSETVAASLLANGSWLTTVPVA